MSSEKVNRYNKSEVSEPTTVDLSSLPQDELDEVLSDGAITEIARQTGALDQRQRKITCHVFFWLMMLSNQHEGRKSLSKLISLVTTVYSTFKWFYGRCFSKKALSVNLVERPYTFFKAIYVYLLSYHLSHFGQKQHMELLHPISDIAVIDASVIQVANELAQIFPSKNQSRSETNKASAKLHAKFSITKSVPVVVNITGERVHDSRFPFIDEQAENVLSIYDLGYWKFEDFIRIDLSDNFVLSRVRSDFNREIVSANDSKDIHLVGQSFKEAVPHIQGETLDVNVFLTATIDGQSVQRLFRVVGVWQVLEKEWHFYLTNLTQRDNPNFTPQFIQILYALRWQIEVFFRDLKSVLKITNFVSESENGVKIQIYAALCFYVLTQIFIHKAAALGNIPVEDFSVPKSLHLVGKVLEMTHNLLVIGGTIDWHVVEQQIIQLLLANGIRDNRRKHNIFKVRKCLSSQ